MVSVRYILILGLILSLIVPVFGIDLTGYDGYITPKFGASVYGQYWYRSDSVNWYWATPSFESNGGYYDIYDDNEIVDFQITINTTFSGELYLFLFYENKEGHYDFSNYLIHSGGSGDYSKVRYSKEVEIPSNAYGDCFYQFVLHTGSSYKYSKEYTFFTKRGLNTNWKQKRQITISSTEKLKNGIAELNLNSTYMQNVNVNYTNDVDASGNLYSYSGTLTDLVFTNDDYTKAYPYFINKYKGGYYEYNRNTANNTLIDLWINENITTENIYMFYDYKFKLSSYIYGSSVNYQHDRPNNPFTVHQIFSDYRWTSDTYNSEIATHTGTYYRGNKISHNYDVNIEPKILSNVSQIYFSIRFEPPYETYYGSALLFADWNIAWNTGSDTQEFRNSTSGNDTYNINAYFKTLTIKIYTNGTHITFKENNIIKMSLPETKTKLGNITKFGTDVDAGLTFTQIVYSYYELPNLAISYSISNATTTKYAYVNFIDLNEYNSFINDLWIGGYFEIDSPGLFLCQDSDKNILGYVHIEKDSTLESFIIVFPYTITNKTNFLNSSEFNYSCSFISDVGGFEVDSDNKTINFTTNRIFLDTIKPYSQHNYTSEYVTYNINSELNYTGIQTDFTLITNKIKCLKFSDDQCIEYDYMNEYNSYNISNISANYNYNNIYEFDTNNWYQQYYRFCRGGTCLSTPSRLFYVYKEKALISFPVDDYIDWNDTDLTNNTEFINNKFWENPLNWFSSFIFQNFIVTQIKDERTLEIFRYTFLIFWSYLFILLIIWMTFLYQFREHYESVKIATISTMPFFVFFAYLGWLGINIVALIVLLITIVVLYLWKR